MATAEEKLKAAYEAYRVAWSTLTEANGALNEASREAVEERKSRRAERYKNPTLPWPNWTWRWYHSGGGTIGSQALNWLMFYTDRVTGEVKGFYAASDKDAPESVLSTDALLALGFTENAPDDLDLN